jgi:hypothetical protein
MEVGTKLPETLRVVSESGSKLICTFFAEDGEHKVTINKKTVVWTHEGPSEGQIIGKGYGARKPTIN